MSVATPNPLASPDPWNMVAPAYAAEILPLFELFAGDALERADLPPNPHIVDVATGPGTLALLAAKRGAEVSAIDFSEQMLAEFKSRLPRELAPHIDLRQGDGQHLPFPDQAFDAAFSMFGLFLFPDRLAGYRELRRVLKPGRRAIVTSWAPFEGPYAILMDAVRAHVPGIPFSPGQAPLGTPDDYHREMKEAGFSSVRVETITHNRLSGSAEDFWAYVQRTNVTLLLLRKKIGEPEWTRLAPAIFEKIQKELGPGQISVPARANLGVGVK